MKYLLLVVACAGLCASPAWAEDLPETTINVVGSVGTLSMYTDREEPFWTKIIPEKSGGQIKVHIKPFTELGFKGGEIFHLISDGTLQIGTTVLSYNSGEVPENEAADLVGIVGSVEELHTLVDTNRESLSRFLQKEHGIKLLGFGTYQAQVLYCRDEFKSLADLKGRKIRTSGASQQDFVTFLGGNPITLAFSEVAPALTTGVVDCAIAGAMSGYKSKWFESARYLSPLPISFGLTATMANSQWWSSLDPAVQVLLEVSVLELEDAIFDLAATETDAGIACNTTGPCSSGSPGGMHLVPITASDEALLKAAVADAILPKFGERCGTECIDWWNGTIGESIGLAIH